jgi:hypothetical protein
MTFFDEQPDGDPHGECAAEIHRLADNVKQLRHALTVLVNSNYDAGFQLAENALAATEPQNEN